MSINSQIPESFLVSHTKEKCERVDSRENKEIFQTKFILVHQLKLIDKQQ